MVKRGWLVGWLVGAATLRFETDTDARKISFPSFFQRPDARTEPLPLSLRAASPPPPSSPFFVHRFLRLAASKLPFSTRRASCARAAPSVTKGEADK